MNVYQNFMKTPKMNFLHLIKVFKENKFKTREYLKKENSKYNEILSKIIEKIIIDEKNLKIFTKNNNNNREVPIQSIIKFPKITEFNTIFDNKYYNLSIFPSISFIFEENDYLKIKNVENSILIQKKEIIIEKIVKDEEGFIFIESLNFINQNQRWKLEINEFFNLLLIKNNNIWYAIKLYCFRNKYKLNYI
jgi:hypothetical protein